MKTFISKLINLFVFEHYSMYIALMYTIITTLLVFLFTAIPNGALKICNSIMFNDYLNSQCYYTNNSSLLSYHLSKHVVTSHMVVYVIFTIKTMFLSLHKLITYKYLNLMTSIICMITIVLMKIFDEHFIFSYLMALPLASLISVIIKNNTSFKHDKYFITMTINLSVVTTTFCIFFINNTAYYYLMAKH